jgi:hypothetical protein
VELLAVGTLSGQVCKAVRRASHYSGLSGLWTSVNLCYAVSSFSSCLPIREGYGMIAAAWLENTLSTLSESTAVTT